MKYYNIDIIDNDRTMADNNDTPDEVRQITAAEIAGMIQGALSSLRVYVVESDITSAQSSVRATIEQASF